MEDKIQTITQILSKYGMEYIPIDNDNNIIKIHELFVNDVMFEPNGIIELNYMTIYYRCKKDYDKMVEYYKLAINLGDNVALITLGNHFVERLMYDEAILYFLTIIDNNNNNCVLHYYLGYCYGKIKKYDDMMKHYLVSINDGHVGSMYNMGFYYAEIKNYSEMVKYYRMAVDNGDIDAMVNLGDYYHKINNYKKIKMYFTMAIEGGYDISTYRIEQYHLDKFLRLEFYLNHNYYEDFCKLLAVMLKTVMNRKQRNIFYELFTNADPDENDLNNPLRMLLHFANKNNAYLL